LCSAQVEYWRDLFYHQKNATLLLQAVCLGSSICCPRNTGAVGQGQLYGIILKAPQKNRAKPEKQKGKKEGGLGEGIFALLRLRIERFRFSLIKRNTAKTEKNFLFLLKEKIAREKIKKCRENFSVLVCRSGAEASGNAPHSCSGFSLKKVRISFRIRSQIVCSAFVASAQSASARALGAKADFKRICHAPRGSKTNSRSRKIRFAVAKQQNSANGGIANLFFSPLRASCKAIIIPRSGIAQKRYY
jgi:hypothetical protein